MPSIYDSTQPITSFPNRFTSPFGNDLVIPIYSSVPVSNQNVGGNCIPCVICEKRDAFLDSYGFSGTRSGGGGNVGNGGNDNRNVIIELQPPYPPIGCQCAKGTSYIIPNCNNNQNLVSFTNCEGTPNETTCYYCYPKEPTDCGHPNGTSAVPISCHPNSVLKTIITQSCSGEGEVVSYYCDSCNIPYYTPPNNLPLAVPWDGSTTAPAPSYLNLYQYYPSIPSGTQGDYSPVYGYGTGAIQITQQQYIDWCTKISLLAVSGTAQKSSQTHEFGFPITKGGSGIGYVQDIPNSQIGGNYSGYNYGWTPAFWDNGGGYSYVACPQTGYDDDKCNGIFTGTFQPTGGSVPRFNTYFADYTGRSINYSAPELNSYVVGLETIGDCCVILGRILFVRDSLSNIYAIPFFTIGFGSLAISGIGSCASFMGFCIGCTQEECGTLSIGGIGNVPLFREGDNFTYSVNIVPVKYY